MYEKYQWELQNRFNFYYFNWILTIYFYVSFIVSLRTQSKGTDLCKWDLIYVFVKESGRKAIVQRLKRVALYGLTYYYPRLITATEIETVKGPLDIKTQRGA